MPVNRKIRIWRIKHISVITVFIRGKRGPRRLRLLSQNLLHFDYKLSLLGCLLCYLGLNLRLLIHLYPQLIFHLRYRHVLLCCFAMISIKIWRSHLIISLFLTSIKWRLYQIIRLLGGLNGIILQNFLSFLLVKIVKGGVWLPHLYLFDRSDFIIHLFHLTLYVWKLLIQALQRLLYLLLFTSILSFSQPLSIPCGLHRRSSLQIIKIFYENFRFMLLYKLL